MAQAYVDSPNSLPLLTTLYHQFHQDGKTVNFVPAEDILSIISPRFSTAFANAYNPNNPGYTRRLELEEKGVSDLHNRSYSFKPLPTGFLQPLISPSTLTNTAS